MKDRIKQIRKYFGLSQAEFGQRVGVKGNTIGNYEIGLRAPSDAVIFSICREFNISEPWLRTGEGEMLDQTDPDIELAKIFGQIAGSDDDLIKAIIKSYWLLDDNCKLLEVGDAALVQGKPQVLGLTAVNPTVGNTLTVSPEQQDKLERLQAFFAAIRGRVMTGSLKGFIDLTSGNEIRFGYGENLTVVFPLNGDFASETHELELALKTMDQRGLPRTGTLDQNYEDRKIHLLPDRWLPDGWSALEDAGQQSGSESQPEESAQPQQTEDPQPEHTPTVPQQAPEEAQ